MASIRDASMFHKNAFNWGASARTIGTPAIGDFVTKDYPAEGNQLRMPDTSGKGSVQTWTSRLVLLSIDEQLLRMKVASVGTTAQISGPIFEMQGPGGIHWQIRDAASDKWELLDRNGVVQATISNPMSGPTVLDKVKIRWENSSSGLLVMHVNGVIVLSVLGKAFNRTAGDSALKLWGTHDAPGARLFTIANYIIETAVTAETNPGTDDWYIPKYITNMTGSGHTDAAGLGGLAETFDSDSWPEISDNNAATNAGYDNPNGNTGAGVYTDKSGNRGPSGDSEILPSWVMRGMSWGFRIFSLFPAASVDVAYGKWDGASTVTLTADGASTVIYRDFFVKAGVSPCPAKTDTGWLGFKRGGGSSSILLVEAACFAVVDVVPVAATPLIIGPPVFKSPKPVKSA